MSFKTLIVAALAVAFCFPVLATEGTHVTVDELNAALNEAVALGQGTVKVVEVEVVREVPVEVIREVEVAAPVDSTFVIGIGGGNGKCAAFEAEAFAEYDLDSAGRPMHLNIHVAPNGSCSGQGTGIDAAMAQRFDVTDAIYGVVGAGYDQHVIPFEYTSADGGACVDGFKCFHSEEVPTTNLYAGIGYRIGDDWTVTARLNAVDNPLGAGGNLSPVSVGVSGRLYGFEIDSTIMGSGIAELDVTRDIGGWQIGLRASANAAKLENPAPLMLSGLTRKAGPTVVYSFDIGKRF